MGEWRMLAGDWSRPVSVACQLCGRPLFGRVWSAEVDGAQANFCGPDCETLLHEYWLPQHGSEAPTEG